jgi:ribonuclease HI
MYFCYTDGSCRVSERSPGGWGVYIRPPNGNVGNEKADMLARHLSKKLIKY